MHAQFLDSFCQKVRAENNRGHPTVLTDDSTIGVLMRHLYEASQVVVPAIRLRLETELHSLGYVQQVSEYS